MEYLFRKSRNICQKSKNERINIKNGTDFMGLPWTIFTVENEEIFIKLNKLTHL
ncbi:MAG: hypothetical protein JWQ63_1603 [Mucilaginibacter sp.]|nr:hypothetical protein [Mucilaginibacter sp.]